MKVERERRCPDALWGDIRRRLGHVHRSARTTRRVPYCAPRCRWRQERGADYAMGGDKNIVTTNRYMHLCPTTMEGLADVLAQYTEAPQLKIVA